MFQTLIRPVVRRVLPPTIRRGLRRMLGWSSPPGVPVSSGYEVLNGEVPVELKAGWQDPAVPRRQQAAFEPLLEALRGGRPREDFAALAAAVQAAGVQDPAVLEVGCGSGWNFEVLDRLCPGTFSYLGMDYSKGMIDLARNLYPDCPFVVGDATQLPFRSASHDIVVSGTVLMHLTDHSEAIRECRRVAARWCVFHSVPILHHGPTRRLRKLAYGSPVVEVIFNETELLRSFRSVGLDVRESMESVPYDVSGLLGEKTHTRTYLCAKA